MKTTKLLPLLVVALLAACGEKEAPVAEAPAQKAAPVAATPAEPAAAPVAAAEPAASAADLALGEKTFNANCVSCHGSGVLGAPKIGDNAAWAPRIAKGKETLYKNALDGFKMMPPRGGNPGLKDEEIKAVVDYMVSKAG